MSEEKTVVIRMSEGAHDCCCECMRWRQDTQDAGPVLSYEGTNDLLCWSCGFDRAPELKAMVADFFYPHEDSEAFGFRNHAVLDPNDPAMNFQEEASPARET